MEAQEQEYIKGFNHGYILANHEPELAKQIVSTKNDHNEYFKGLASGKQEFDMEKAKERLKGVTRKESEVKDITKNKGKER